MKEYQDTTHTHTHTQQTYLKEEGWDLRGYFKTGLPKIVTGMSI